MKKVSITYREIQSVNSAIELMLATSNGLPSNVVYGLVKNSRLIKPAISDIVAKQKELLKYANKNENGQPKIVDRRLDIPEENKEKYRNALSKINETKTEVAFHKIKASESDYIINSGGLSENGDNELLYSLFTYIFE